MRKINSIRIDRFYDMYRCYGAHNEEHNNYGPGAKGRDISSMWYYCANCGTTFMVKHWGRTFAMYCYDHGERNVACPECGKTYVAYEKNSEIDTCVNKHDFKKENVASLAESPYSAILRLYETKRGNIKLKADFKVIRMHLTGDMNDAIVEFDKRSEVVEFDIKNRKTTLKINKMPAVELGHPRDWNKLTINSKLCDIAANVLHHPVNVKGWESQEEKEKIQAAWFGQLKGFIKDLKTSIQSKWKEVHGFPLKNISTNASYSASGGFLLRHIHNIAFRMVYPDLPNIRITDNSLSTYFGSLPALENFDAGRKARNSVQYIIESLELPNKPSIRRMVTKKPLVAPELKIAMGITDNFDCNMAIYHRVHELTEKGWDCGFKHFGDKKLDDSEISSIYTFLKFVSPVYKASSIRNYIVNTKDYERLKDTIRLARGIHIKEFTAPLSKMHDVLVEVHNRMEAELRRQLELERAEDDKFRKKLAALRSCDAFALEIPEAVKNRLVMQLEAGQGRFFLPETNKDLSYTSEIMHNCVRTYEENIMRQRCNIVYYTDDNGKLLACIEVKGNAIVQAKLKFNKHVRNNPEINRIIRNWTKEKGLRVETYDIMSEEEENRQKADAESIGAA